MKEVVTGTMIETDTEIMIETDTEMMIETGTETGIVTETDTGTGMIMIKDVRQKVKQKSKNLNICK